jgi:hypothetical protein
MSDPLTAEELIEIRGRADEATQGPWSVRHNYHYDDGDWRDSDIRCHPTGAVFGGIPQVLAYADLDEADAEFIAHARADVPRLLDENERAWRAFRLVQEKRYAAQVRINAALKIHEAHIGRPGGRIETDCVCVGCEMARALKGGGE